MDGVRGVERRHGDFEFERRFLVTGLPDRVRVAPATIIQGYLLADGGHAVRVRVQAIGVDTPMTPDVDPVGLLDGLAGQVNHATVGVKGPPVGGTRYEAERDIDPIEACQILHRAGCPVVVKVRYVARLHGTWWVIDVFGGPNHPLVIAEAERPDPVTDLTIPAWCRTEITDEARFTNDALAARPYPVWQAEHEHELTTRGVRFRTDFGTNHHGDDGGHR